MTHKHEHQNQSIKNIRLVFFLNLIFSLLEFVFGTFLNSAAIISDAVHDLGDSISVGLSWFFQKFSTKESNDKFSFGYQRFSLIGALITAVVLLIGSAAVIYRSIPILFNPQPVNTTGMFWFSFIAIGVNGYAAWLMHKGSSKNENFLNLHMLEDVLGWVGILIVSIVIRFTDFYILDPIFSLLIALYILIQALPKFYNTLMVFLERVPEGVDINSLEQNILAINGVKDFSHFHIWSLDGEANAFSVTLLVPKETISEGSRIKKDVRHLLDDLNVTHSTIELVTDEKDLQKHAH